VKVGSDRRDGFQRQLADELHFEIRKNGKPVQSAGLSAGALIEAAAGGWLLRNA
jgi:hypothetical protein